MDVKGTLVTSRGRTVQLRPVSAFLLQKLQQDAERAARERNEPLDPPVYVVQTVAGDVERHAHTEKTAAKEGYESETWQQWCRYVKAQEALKEAITEKWTRLCLYDGVIEDEHYQDTAWVKRLDFLGIAVPADPMERWWVYITCELLDRPEDQAEATLRVMAMSAQRGASEEDIAAAVANFRRPLPARPDATGNEQAAPGTGTGEGALAAQQSDAGSADGEGVGPSTKRLPRAKRRGQG